LFGELHGGSGANARAAARYQHYFAAEAPHLKLETHIETHPIGPGRHNVGEE
jgi:hypothetical protein